MNFLTGYLLAKSVTSLEVSLFKLVFMFIKALFWCIGKVCKLSWEIVITVCPLVYQALVWTVKSIIRLSKYIVRQYRLYRERRIIEANKGFIEC